MRRLACIIAGRGLLLASCAPLAQVAEHRPDTIGVRTQGAIVTQGAVKTQGAVIRQGAVKTQGAVITQGAIRTQACAACHGPDGEGTGDDDFPGLACKPAGHLFNQLLTFTEGRRRYPPMNYLPGIICRLTRLSDHLAVRSQSSFMSGSLVPAEKAQIDKLKGDIWPQASVTPVGRAHPGTPGRRCRARYPEGGRPRSAARLPERRGHRAVRRAQSGRLPHPWPWRGRQKGSREWLGITAGFIGYAAGRTDFRSSLAASRGRKVTREAAVAKIAGHYREFVGTFEKTGFDKAEPSAATRTSG